jgi:3-oxoacyl-[acyl-carrier protein] reductase
MAGSRGIGRGIAAALALEGARVALTSRSRDRAEEVAGELEGEVVGFAADARNPVALPGVVGAVEEALGPVDILVINTGGPPPGDALDNPLSEWEEAYRSLVLAPRALIEAVLPGMRERGWGRIVNVGSTSVREPIPGLGLSNVHRAAAVGFLRTLAREIASEGITANTVATGRFDTDRQFEGGASREEVEARAREEVPAGRLGTPQEYGDLVAFLCSDRAAYLTGAVVPLDGGLLHSA